MDEKELIRKGHKVLGEYYPDRKLYVSHRTRKLHYFRLWGAWGIDEDVLQKLAEKGCMELRIVSHEADNTEQVYRTTPGHFREAGKKWTNPKDQQIQIMLSEIRFIIPKGKQTRLSAW